jgi:hypothetical protein
MVDDRHELGFKYAVKLCLGKEDIHSMKPIPEHTRLFSLAGNVIGWKGHRVFSIYLITTPLNNLKLVFLKPLY